MTQTFEFPCFETNSTLFNFKNSIDATEGMYMTAGYNPLSSTNYINYVGAWVYFCPYISSKEYIPFDAISFIKRYTTTSTLSFGLYGSISAKNPFPGDLAYNLGTKTSSVTTLETHELSEVFKVKGFFWVGVKIAAGNSFAGGLRSRHDFNPFGFPFGATDLWGNNGMGGLRMDYGTNTSTELPTTASNFEIVSGGPNIGLRLASDEEISV